MENEIIEEKKEPENLSEDKKAKEGLEARKKTSLKSRKVKRIPAQIVKKNNYFTRNNIAQIDYKNTKLLNHFVNKQGQIIPKTFAKLPSKIQRIVAKNIKRARQMKLMPYVIVNQGDF